MNELSLVSDLDRFDFGLEEAASVLTQSGNLYDVFKDAPGSELNNTAMQTLHQAIESMQERTGVFYSTVSMESSTTATELKTYTLEGLKEFGKSVWQAIVKALAALYAKIKEFFTGNERKVKKMKEDLKKADEDYKQASKDAVKADKEATEVYFELDNPAHQLLHKSLYTGSNKASGVSVTTELHDIVSHLNDYVMKSKEHHLIEGISDFKEKLLVVLDSVDADKLKSDTDSKTLVVDKLYTVMDNYVNGSTLHYEVNVNKAKFKDVTTHTEFDAEYGGKRYVIDFSTSKSTDPLSVNNLRTDGIISRVRSAIDVEKLIIKGVESRDVYHLSDALSLNMENQTKGVLVSKELLSLVEHLTNMVKSAEKDESLGSDNKYVIILSLVIKAVNAIVKLFTVIHSDVSATVTAHFNLYLKFIEELKKQNQTV